MEFNAIGFYTLLKKELKRFWVVGIQTILSPMVTALLYLLVFSYVLEERVDVYPGISYTEFLVPGLIMMSMIQNAFANSSSSLIMSKVTGHMIFILVPPLSGPELYLAYVLASVLRALLVGFSIFGIATLFVGSMLINPILVLVFGILGSALMGACGLIIGLWAENFDQTAAFTNFIVIPFSFLSGVFYSIQDLPAFWRSVSHFNPFFYMIDGFRAGFIGHSDVPLWFSLGIVCGFLALISAIALYLLHTGYRIRE